MEVNDELLDHLCKISRIRLEGEERELMKKDLEKVIQFFKKVKEANLAEIEPMRFVNPHENKLRKDEIKKLNDKEASFLNSPLHKDDFFLVPKVIKK